MNTNNRPSLASRLTGGLLVATLSLALFAPSASAVTVNLTSTITPADPLMANLISPGGYTETQPDFGTFDFTSQIAAGDYATSLGKINITLRIFNLDTNVGGLDFDNITLRLGGFDTGIVLNGYGQGFATLSFNDQTINNAAAIMSVINSTRMLTAGINDKTSAGIVADGSGSNYFNFTNLSVTFAFVSATVVPFSPVQALGLGLVGLAAGFRQLRRRGLIASLFAVRA